MLPTMLLNSGSPTPISRSIDSLTVFVVIRGPGVYKILPANESISLRIQKKKKLKNFKINLYAALQMHDIEQQPIQNNFYLIS